MGKKSSGKTYTSKGERANVASSTLNSIKRDLDGGQKMTNIQNAFIQGRNPWITIANPNKNETNKKFIKVRVKDLYGYDHKDRVKNAYRMKGE